MVAKYNPDLACFRCPKMPKHRGLEYGAKVFPEGSQKPVLDVRLYMPTPKTYSCAVYLNDTLSAHTLVASIPDTDDAYQAFRTAAMNHGFIFAATDDDVYLGDPHRRILKAIQAMADALGLQSPHIVQMWP